MKKFFLLLIFSRVFLAQTDWVKWEKADVSYQIPESKQQQNYFDESGIGSMILSGLKYSYSFLISDVDGDNCPFYPSCSTFYISSIKETNFIQGTLMFADRFTRDSNMFKKRDQYAHHISGKLYDPTFNYFLLQNKIHYYSRDKIVE